MFLLKISGLDNVFQSSKTGINPSQGPQRFELKTVYQQGKTKACKLRIEN